HVLVQVLDRHDATEARVSAEPPETDGRHAATADRAMDLVPADRFRGIRHRPRIISHGPCALRLGAQPPLGNPCRTSMRYTSCLETPISVAMLATRPSWASIMAER